MKHANVAIFVPHVGCPNQCSFCNQHTISGSQTLPTPQEVGRICKQAVSQLGERSAESEIAFFGGSFTAIEKGYMESLLKAASPYVGEGKMKGIRISTRPDAIDKERLELLKRYGVTAIELGAQSMDDQVLSLNRRGHTAGDVIRAAKLVQEYKVELGLQMMVGLYAQTTGGVHQTALELAALCPQTMRIYPTIVVKDTPLDKLYQEQKYCPLTLDEAITICSELLLFFESRNIRVIRLGLHASEVLEGGITAGPYHPAFRELCMGEIFYNHTLSALKKTHQKTATIQIPKGATSQMVGQNKRNIKRLNEDGYYIKIIEDDSLSGYQIRILENSKQKGK